MSLSARESVSIDACEPLSVYLLAMAKRRLQIWLSEKALAELERRAGASDKRQDYIERLLTDELPEQQHARFISTAAALKAERESVDPDPGAEQAVRNHRKKKKVARAGRKAAAIESVKAALPMRPSTDAPEPILKASQVAVPHNFHSGVNPVAGCVQCKALVK